MKFTAVSWPHMLTPIQYGQMIAERRTLAERSELIKQVPESWRLPVLYNAAHYLAPELADLMDRGEHRAALAELPGELLTHAVALARSLALSRKKTQGG